ncbi:MAG: 2-dehydropantoate 2-reductase [Bacteroidales bacterium]|nr:2-dehydropantoate 2-reductase [Bacteroidales bacterium]
MKSTDLSFLVVGAGAIGGITAAILKKNGFNVEIVCKYGDYADLISRHGIEVKGVCGDFTIVIPAYSAITDVKVKKDIILHATKATDMVEAAQTMKPVLKQNGYVISMQNGICEDDLGAVLGKERVIGCVTGWGATMESPGKMVMASTGEFVLGYLEREPDEFLTEVGEVLSSIVPVRTTDNIMGHLYSKLIINSCINSLGDICGLYLGKMLSISKVRRIFIEIIREAVEVADKMKIRIEVFGGKMDFRKFVKGDDFFSNLRRHLLIMIIGYKYRKLKSSSLQSLEGGKLTEVDYFNGYIVRNGLHYGVPVPVNSEIMKMIHEIELKKRDISVSNFDDPSFDRFNT